MTYVHPIITIMLKNVLITFSAEILEVFKNIQPQPKTLTFLQTKKSDCVGRTTTPG